MRDGLLVIDVINDFSHPDGDILLASFQERNDAMCAVLQDARSRGIPVFYANDNRGVWDGDAPGMIRRAVAAEPGGTLVAAVAPQPGEPFIVKPRYSAFDSTPLELLLTEADLERLVLIGASLEMCVAQTAIDAREHGWKVTIVPDACPTIDAEMADVALAYLARVAGVQLHAEPSMPPAPAATPT